MSIFCFLYAFFFSLRFIAPSRIVHFCPIAHCAFLSHHWDNFPRIALASYAGLFIVHFCPIIGTTFLVLPWHHMPAFSLCIFVPSLGQQSPSFRTTAAEEEAHAKVSQSHEHQRPNRITERLFSRRTISRGSWISWSFLHLHFANVTCR